LIIQRGAKSVMMMLDVVGLVRVTERHPNRFDFRLAEILEHERFDAGLSFDSLVEVAAPAIGAQLARAQDEDIAAYYFDPFHKSHLPDMEWLQVSGG
jgi:hypothetical protein